MKVFKNAWFERFSRKHRITDQALLEAVQRAENGQIDANLGGGVLKQRVSRQGQGKSGGFRTIIFYRTAERAFFVYGFAKNDRCNINSDEELQFKKAATHVLGLTDAQLSELIMIGQLSEVTEDG
ncbi:type II toxin-antitoxin system RelE/ParE family toxin [Nitrincola sp. MINF-07-Sa-05]|uniref:type II toxin-antitoxin system RelE/ParE family toxin n=1 Tax=Nitrincola salilacus TaxID=3400273 RepID=UPI0039185843